MTSSDQTQPSLGLYRFAFVTSFFTVLLLLAGALVTNNEAGDSVPDWPLAYGRLIPPMVGGTRFEYSHRVIAGIVAILTLVLAIWIARADRRPLARRLGWNALALVIAQAVLGGIRVLMGNPGLSATVHATLAQLFLLTIVGLTLYLSPWWQRDLPHLADAGSPSARTLTFWTTIAIVVQILLGAALRHGALDLTPHVVGACVVTVMVFWAGRAVKKRFRGVRELRVGVALLHSFFGIQFLLGLAAWWAMTSAPHFVEPVTFLVTLLVAHVLGGALTLASSVVLMMACFRLTGPAAVAASAPAGSSSGTGA
ncbi:MAG: COX15/CtaA family protein [Acidobacteriia bacterium]|nr:COX15/CtaA family protein [Terriglobia bacterium]